MSDQFPESTMRLGSGGVGPQATAGGTVIQGSDGAPTQAGQGHPPFTPQPAPQFTPQPAPQFTPQPAPQFAPQHAPQFTPQHAQQPAAAPRYQAAHRPGVAVSIPPTQGHAPAAHSHGRGDELQQGVGNTVYEFTGGAAPQRQGGTFFGDFSSVPDVERDRPEDRNSNLKGSSVGWVLGLIGLVIIGGGFAYLSATVASDDSDEPAKEAKAEVKAAAETKAEETKAEETKAEETKAATETKAEETKAAAETKAEETKAEEKPAEKPEEKPAPKPVTKKKKATTKKPEEKKATVLTPKKPPKLEPKKPPRDDGLDNLPKPP